MGLHIKNLFSIYNPMHPLILKIYLSLIMVCIGMSYFIIYSSHINEHSPGRYAIPMDGHTRHRYYVCRI